MEETNSAFELRSWLANIDSNDNDPDQPYKCPRCLELPNFKYKCEAIQHVIIEHGLENSNYEVCQYCIEFFPF